MPELLLDHPDRVRLADLLRGQARPPAVRPGTWARVLRSDLDVLEMDELAAIAGAFPETAKVLQLPWRVWRLS